MNLKEVLSDAN